MTLLRYIIIIVMLYILQIPGGEGGGRVPDRRPSFKSAHALVTLGNVPKSFQNIVHTAIRWKLKHYILNFSFINIWLLVTFNWRYEIFLVTFDWRYEIFLVTFDFFQFQSFQSIHDSVSRLVADGFNSASNTLFVRGVHPNMTFYYYTINIHNPRYTV